MKVIVKLASNELVSWPLDVCSSEEAKYKYDVGAVVPSYNEELDQQYEVVSRIFTELPNESPTLTLLVKLYEPAVEEPLPSDPTITDPSIVATELQILKTADSWHYMIRSASLDPEEDSFVMLPTWLKHRTDYKIPEEALVSLNESAVQKLFDGLWRDGYRPTGTQVTVTELPLEESVTITLGPDELDEFNEGSLPHALQLDRMYRFVELKNTPDSEEPDATDDIG